MCATVLAEDPEIRAFRSGFWATLPIPPSAPGAIELGIAARLRGGEEVERPLGRIEIAEPPGPSSARPRPGLIAVCMATYEPDPELFRGQIESLRAQTDDGLGLRDQRRPLGPGALRGDRARSCGDDPRFVASRADRAASGFYRNFERALAPRAARAPSCIALCDQDDRWYPEKLAALRGATRRRRGWSTPTSGWSTRAGACCATTHVGGPAQQPHRPRVAAGRQHA